MSMCGFAAHTQKAALPSFLDRTTHMQAAFAPALSQMGTAAQPHWWVELNYGGWKIIGEFEIESGSLPVGMKGKT